MGIGHQALDRAVEGSVFVDGLEKDGEIDQLRLRPSTFLTISSFSSAAAMVRALSRLVLGEPIAWVRSRWRCFCEDGLGEVRMAAS